MRTCFERTRWGRCIHRRARIESAMTWIALPISRSIRRHDPGFDSIRSASCDAGPGERSAIPPSNRVQAQTVGKRRIGAIARQTLTAFAPVVLFVLALVIMTLADGWFTGVDLAFLCVLAAAVAGRELERRQKHRTRPNSRQPPIANVLVLGLAVWVVANVLGNILLAT